MRRQIRGSASFFQSLLTMLVVCEGGDGAPLGRHRRPTGKLSLPVAGLRLAPRDLQIDRHPLPHAIIDAAPYTTNRLPGAPDERRDVVVVARLGRRLREVIVA